MSDVDWVGDSSPVAPGQLYKWQKALSRLALSCHLGWQEQCSPWPARCLWLVSNGAGRRCGKDFFPPTPLVCAALKHKSGSQNCKFWLLAELLNSLRKANPPTPPRPPPPVATLEDVPVRHAAKAIYSWNKAGPGVAVPGPAPFETPGKAAAAWVPVCTLLCINVRANWASAGKGSVWLNGTQSKCQLNRFSLS